MTVDIDMEIYVPISDFDECLQEVVSACEGKHQIDLKTPSGAQIKCPLSDEDVKMAGRKKLLKESDLGEGITVEIAGGEFNLNADFGERFARINLRWCSGFSVTGEIYDDLVEYVDPTGDCIRTIGLPGEMSLLVRNGRHVFCSDKGRVELADPDDIDTAGDMWLAAKKKGGR